MRRAYRNLIPSQFHRRLVLLTMVAMAAMAVLLLRVAALTTTRSDELRAQAQRALSRTELIPTTRGRIFDRFGRVLAENQPCFDLAVRYNVLSGAWAYEQAHRDARAAYADTWAELGYMARQRHVDEFRPVYERQVEELFTTLASLGEVSREELARRRDTIVQRVSQMADRLWEAWRRQRLEQVDEPVTLGDVAQPIAEHQAYHTLMSALSPEARVAIERRIDRAQANDQRRDARGGRVFNELGVWSGVRIERGTTRRYPLETMDVVVARDKFPTPLVYPEPTQVRVAGVGLQIIGQLREVQREDMQRRPFQRTSSEDSGAAAGVDLGGYRLGDMAGRWGIEASQEDALRGTRGRVVHRLDTGEQTRAEPVPGEDVLLTLDIQLQARIQALLQPELGLMRTQAWHFDGAAQSPSYHQPLAGAVVVMAVTTGEVLAAVSSPSFSLRDLEERPQWVWNDPIDLPYVSRAYGRSYMPGSIVKPLVLSALVTEGKLAPGATIRCNGMYDPAHPNIWRCWIYKMSSGNHTHGDLTGPEAIAHSCNVFFHTAAARLGTERLVRWYDKFGLGRRPVVGLEERELASGHLPDLAKVDELKGTDFSVASGLFMGIGQGPIDWSPMQAAAAYATLARHGERLDPTFLREPMGESRHGEDLRLSPRAVEMAMAGLEQSVAYGTTHHITIDGRRERVFTIGDVVEGIKIRAKSGTADPGRRWRDLNRNEQVDAGELRHWGDHAWVLALLQKPGSSRPDYVVAVLVEYAGSGGRAAGPVANQVLYALRAEGYL